MAWAVESTAQNSTLTSSLVITKPTGLTVGELLVAQLSLSSATSTSSIAIPAGWTSIGDHAQSATGALRTIIKVADSSDVAASNFTFTSPSSLLLFGGTLYRISGAQTSILGVTDNAGTSTNAISYNFAVSLTPALDGALVLASWASIGFSNGPAVTTFASTPAVTFTESFDYFANNVPDRLCVAGAYGEQSTAAEITEIAATFSNSQDAAMALVTTIYPAINASGTNTLTVATASAFIQSGTCDTTGSSTLSEATTESFTQTGQGDSPTQWSNEAKTVTDWTNEPL